MRLTAGLLCLVLLFGLGAGQARAEGSVTLSAAAGFDGTAKIGAYVPVVAKLTNQGSAVSGTVTVTAYDTSGFGTDYQTPVELAQGAKKEVTFYVPVFELSREILISFKADGAAAVTTKAKLTALPYSEIVIGVLSSDSTTLNHANAVRLTNPVRAVHVVHLNTAALPDQQQAWDNFDFIVLNDFDTATLTPAQLNALRGWVAEGGSLVVGGGPAWQKTLAGLPAELLPVEISGTTQVSDLPALSQLGGSPFQVLAPFTVNTGSLKPGARGELAGEAIGRATLRYGDGELVFFGVDLALDPIAAWRGNEQLWLNGIYESHAAGRLAEMQYKGQGSSRYHMGLANALRNIPALALPAAWQLALLVLAYILIVGPINYLLLKRRDRRDWGWVTIPSIALLVIGVVWFGAFKLKGREVMVNEISLVTLRPELNLRRVESYVGIFAPTRNDYRIRLSGDRLVTNLPNYDGLYYDPMAGDGRAPVLMRVSYSDRTDVAFTNMSAWSLRSFATDRYETGSGGIVADLHGQGDTIVGTLTNASEFMLTDCHLLTVDGLLALGDLAPGASVTVNLSVKPNPGTATAYYSLYNPGASFQGGPGKRAPVQTRDELRKRQILDGAFDGVTTFAQQVQFIGWLAEPLGGPTVDGGKVSNSRLALVTQLMNYDPWDGDHYTIPAGLTSPTLVSQSGPEASWWPGGFHLGNGSRMELDFALTAYRPLNVERVALLAYFDSSISTKPLPASSPMPPQSSSELQIWNYATGRYDKITLTNGTPYEMINPADYVSADGRVRVCIETSSGTWFNSQRLGVAVEGREVR